MTETPKPHAPTIHAIHVTPKHGAHLHYNRHASTDEVKRAGVAARAFLGETRAAPSGLAPGFYPFRVGLDGNGYPGKLVDRLELL